MRDFHLFVPGDCVASQDPGENAHALAHMGRVLKADVRPSGEIDLAGLVGSDNAEGGRGRPNPQPQGAMHAAEADAERR
jgi:hypothetical protein